MNKETLKSMGKPKMILEYLSVQTNIRNGYFYLVLIISIIASNQFGIGITMLCVSMFVLIEYYTMVNYGFVEINE